MATEVARSYTFFYYLWGHMKTFVYETKVDSREELRRRNFAAAEHIRNHPDNTASATQSPLMPAENWVTTGGEHWKITVKQVLYFSTGK